MPGSQRKKVEKREDGESGFGVVATAGREEGEISFHPLCFCLYFIHVSMDPVFLYPAISLITLSLDFIPLNLYIFIYVFIYIHSYI